LKLVLSALSTIGAFIEEEGKIVRGLLLDPGLQGIHSRAWKVIVRNPDAAGSASEQAPMHFSSGLKSWMP
jgi:hypothetical protein